MVAAEVFALRFPRHSVLHRLARRVSLPRPAPKYAFACEQERSRGLVDRLHSLRLLAHHQHGLPKLALRNPGLHRRLFLWLDLAQDRLDFRLRVAPRRRGYYLAFSLSNGVD